MSDPVPNNAHVWGPAVSVAVIFVANVVTYALNPNSWLYKHALAKCGIPPLFFASNRADHVDKRALPKTYWAFDLLEPAHVVQSYILSTPLLLILHLFTFCYFLATVIVDVVIEYYIVNNNRGPYGGWVTFLTNWSITLLGLAGLVAFIDTARHIRRERHARSCLKAAHQQDALQQRTPSQLGNLQATSLISAWRDYEHASRTNSIYSPTQTSPTGTARIVAAISPNTVATHHTNPVSSSPELMLSPSPDRLLITNNGAGYSSTIRPNSGSPAESHAGTNAVHTPVLVRRPAEVSQPAEKQQPNGAGQVQRGYHNSPIDGAQRSEQGDVQLVSRQQHPYGQQQDSTAAAPAAVSPFSISAAEPFDGRHGLQHHKQREPGGAAAPAMGDDVHQRVGDGSISGHATGEDTVVEVEEDKYSGKPRIKGIDEWDWLSGAHCILMETATTAAFFVSFWYWVGIVVIANNGFVTINGGTLMAHAGNVAVAFLQIILTRQPIVSVHFQVLLWYATLYQLFLWIYGEVSGIWRYSLDWQVDKAAGVFALIPGITFIMFLLWYFAALIRERAFIPAAEKVVQHHRSKHSRNHAEQHGAAV